MKRFTKKNYRLFFRSFYLSSVIMFCILFAVFGIARAYKNTVQIGFGQYKDAFEITDEGIRILDFHIDL